MEETKTEQKELVNPLRSERVIVRFIPKYNSRITNKRHVLYGGMAETGRRIFTVPRLSSGKLVNVLTDSEKKYLEEAMGLEYNALSIYKKENNFWEDSNEEGVGRVTLTKQDTYLDLSNPWDYIKYKILLANKDYIAPSQQALEDHPKATYQFVIIEEGQENKMANRRLTYTMEAYMVFGSLKEDKDTMRVIVETMTRRPLAAKVQKDFLQAKINDLIQGNAKEFLRIAKDEYLPTKVIIRNAVEYGIIAKRGDWYYMKKDNTPLCGDGEEPVLNIAARFLNMPRNQELRKSIYDDVQRFRNEE